MTRRRRYAEPSLLLMLTVAGLVSSLAGDGALQALGVAATAVPLLAVLRHVILSPQPAHRRQRHHSKEKYRD